MWAHERLDLRFLALLTSPPSAWPLPEALVRWVGWAAQTSLFFLLAGCSKMRRSEWTGVDLGCARVLIGNNMSRFTLVLQVMGLPA